MKNRLLIALVLLLVLSSYNLQENFSLSPNIKIDTIIIENASILDTNKIKQDLYFLYQKNLFLLNTQEIKTKISQIDLIESFEIKKIYPNDIIIRVFEKKPIAIIQNKSEKKFFTSKGEVINFLDVKRYKTLPIVFGDEKNFAILLNELNKIKFPFRDIKTFYFFKTKRWDLITKQNQTIRLPVKNYKESLKNFIILKDQANFEKYKTFDYRIKDQLILK